MPILPDRKRNFLESLVSKRLVPETSLLEQALKDSIRPLWSESSDRRIQYFNRTPSERTQGKSYPWNEQIALKDPIETSLTRVLRARSSNKALKGQPCLFEDLCDVVQNSFGAKENQKRINPSGGGRYPLEMYVLVHQMQDFQPGAYHYNVRENCFERMWEDQVMPLMLASFPETPANLQNCSFAVILTAVAARSTIKYGHLGLRLIVLEAGHVSEAMWLLATARGLKSWPLGALKERPFSEALGLNPHQEFFVLANLFGR